MNYLRVLITRWSRRDWLAVLVVALVAALLVGTTVLVVSAGDQTSALAAEYETNATVTYFDSLEDAHSAAGSESVVLPTATAKNEAGESKRAIGIPDSSNGIVELPSQPEGAVGPVSSQEEWKIEGETTDESIVVTPGGDTGIFPSSWIMVHSDRLEATGATGGLVVEQTDEPTGDVGSPLVSVLSFFTGGTNDVIGILWTGVAIAGLIVAVTVSSVVRMLISDRSQTIRVARATGAPPRRIYLPLAARAGLLTGVGVAFGYAIGVIVPNAAVNVAVFLGFPTTLSLQVTPSVALLLCGMLSVLTIIGAISGYLTARAATTVSVARFQPRSQTTSASWLGRLPISLPDRCQPTILAPQTLIPTTATLSAFAIIVLLVASLGGVGASLATDGTTITEPDAPHPVASQLPESYAETMDGPEVAASPEILLFGYHDGEPYLARGGDYEAFAAVTDADLTAGRAPATADEAVVGVALADTLNLEPGDELTMGGSTEAGVAQVTIVGTYETGGIDDHQVLVPLQTARHLTTVQEGHVNVIRTDATTSVSSDESSPVVLDVDAPRYSGPADPIPIEVTVWNPAEESRERTVSVELGNTSTEETVTIPPQERSTVELEFTDPPKGEHELAVGSLQQPITVTDTLPIDAAYPSEAQPGEAVQIRISDVSGSPIDNGTVSLDGNTVPIDSDGTAWVQTPETTGTHEIVVQSDEQELRESIRVTADVPHTLVAETSIEPSEPTVHVRPSATITVWNPWNATIETPIVIEGPGTQYEEQVRLEPGNETELTTTLERRPPGEHTVAVSTDDQTLTTNTYQVEGDERLGAALASSGHYGGGGGLGTAIEYAIGNLYVLLTAMVSLTAITVAGAMSAVLARAIRAKRRTLGVYRATGASPERILWLVIVDAIRIGVLSSLLALGIAIFVTSALGTLGQLTAFGIALDPWPSTTLAVGVLIGGVALTLVAALVVTTIVVRTPVQELLSPRSISTTHTTAST